MRIAPLFSALLLSLCSTAQVSYQEVSSAQGIIHTYVAGIAGGGVSFVDFNKDGWDDLTLATGLNSDLMFFLNDHGSFQCIEPPLVTHTGMAKQVLWADIDNDDDYDLLVVSHLSGCALYENTGNMNLVDITGSSGLFQSNMRTYSAAFGDFDNDGLLDIYVANSAGDQGPQPNKLYHNNGDLTFSDVTISAGVTDSFGISLCTAWIDFDKDGLLDIYVSNDKATPNKLYKNNGDSTFIDFGASANADLVLDAMSVTVGDYNQDNWPDIYITNNVAQGGDLNGLSALLRNNRDGTFSEVADSLGLGFGGYGWSAQFLDADLDKDLDLYVSGAIAGTSYPSSTFFEHIDTSTYLIPVGAGFDGDTVISYSNATGDFNRDGYPDIFVSNRIVNSHLWKNNGGMRNWLKIGLRGTSSNRDGVGSWIDCFAGGQRYTAFTHCGESYLSQNSHFKLFGLDTLSIVDSVQVTWPSGITDIVYDVAANQEIWIEEGTWTFTGLLKVNVKVYLEGAYEGVGDSMSTALNSLLPLQQPYDSIPGYAYLGTESVDTMPASVVDWVLLDLIEPGSLTIVARRAALLSNSGMIVDLDGISPVTYNSIPGAYFISVRHRNHLDIASSQQYALLGGDTTTVDLTIGQVPGPSWAQPTPGIFALRMGDVNGDHLIKYNGAENDKNAVLGEVGLLTPNNIVPGYNQYDVNMDGVVKYNGANNDKNAILEQVGLLTPNNVVTGQMFD